MNKVKCTILPRPPTVIAVWKLLVAEQRAHHDAFVVGNADQLEGALKSSGRPITDPGSGLAVPRIDVRTAVDAIKR